MLARWNNRPSYTIFQRTTGQFLLYVSAFQDYATYSKILIFYTSMSVQEKFSLQFEEQFLLFMMVTSVHVSGFPDSLISFCDLQNFSL
jgi:hypothetical protein